MKTFALLFILISAIAGGYLWTNRVSIFVEKMEAALEMDVKTSNIRIGFTSLTLKNLKLTDPKDQSSYDSESVTLEFAPLSFLFGPIIIQKISLTNTTLNYNTPQLTESSVKGIIGKGLRFLAKKLDKPEKKSGTQTPKFEIRSLYAKNLKLRVRHPLKNETIDLPVIPEMKIGEIKNANATNLKSLLDVVLNTLITQAHN